MDGPRYHLMTDSFGDRWFTLRTVLRKCQTAGCRRDGSGPGTCEPRESGDCAGASVDSRLALEPADIADDLLDVFRRDSVDPGHVPEVPMVGADAVRGRSLEGDVRMMIGLVDLVDQRRALSGAGGPVSMAAGAVGLELGLAGPKLRRDRRILCRRSVGAGGGKTGHQQTNGPPCPHRNLLRHGIACLIFSRHPFAHSGFRSGASARSNCRRNISVVRFIVTRR